MLNIKKHSIFSREEKRDCEEYQDKGGVLAVWGSPGSGKTTVAVKLAKYLADRKRNVSLLFAGGFRVRTFAGEHFGRDSCDAESGTSELRGAQTSGLSDDSGDAERGE